MAYAGFMHERVKSNLIIILSVWLSQHRIGRPFAETTYRLTDEEALAPDLSILSNERITPVTKDLPRGAPDLAIEIVSSETAARLRTKIKLYLKNGSRAVWVVYPEEQIVEIHSATGQIRELERDQVLEDHDAVPGFSTPVSAIFEGL